MTDYSAPLFTSTRLAVVITAAGLLFAPLALAQTRLPPPQYGTADTRQDQIEELQSQLTATTAENEDLQRQLNEAQREIQRLRNMVGELSSVNQSLSEGQPEEGEAPAAETRTRPGAEAAPSGLNGAQRAHTGTLGTMSADAAPVPAVRLEPGDAYSRARELLVNGQYAEAEVAFGSFLEEYPDADTAADARFWFAFTQLARNNYRDAAANFVQYLQRTPNGARAPEAQVRLGMALAGMEQTTQACQAFNSLVRRYPNAPRNVRDLAAREARAAECAA